MIWMEAAVLFFEFFKIGLFSIGGGLATIPFLYALADKYDWFTKEMVINMIAVSESTPGPIGINMATFTGFQNRGVFGALIATVGLVFPSVIIIIIISKFLKKFRQNPYVERVFFGIRPVVTGLIAAAGFGVITSALFSGVPFLEGKWNLGFFRFKEIALFVALLVISHRTKKHPIVYIALAALCGILFSF